MNILFMIPALTVGGIEVLALRLAEALGKSGHNVVLYDFSPEHRDKKLISQYDSNSFVLEGAEFHSWKGHLFWLVNSLLFKSGINKSFRRRAAEWQFAKFVKSSKFDIVCSLSFHEDFVACKYCPPLGIPVVTSMHGTYEYAAPQWPEKAQFIYENTQAIIYVADKNLEWYRQQSFFDVNKPIYKIYTGLDINEPILHAVSRTDLGLSDTNFVFIMVARGIPEKGWLPAIKAFIKLHSYFPESALLLVGSSEYIKQLKNDFEQEDGIIFYGSHANPIELGRLANVGLLPTHFAIESLPSSIMEYLRCGMPVISTDIGEIKDMISFEGQLAGIILPLLPGGHGVNVEDLFNAMKVFLTDKKYYVTTSELAKKAVAKFDINKSVQNYIQVFEQVIGK